MSEIWRKGALANHGIKDQKLGVRRYQNKDGSLTAEDDHKKVPNKITVGALPDSNDDSTTEDGADGE